MSVSKEHGALFDFLLFSILDTLVVFALSKTNDKLKSITISAIVMSLHRPFSLLNGNKLSTAYVGRTVLRV